VTIRPGAAVLTAFGADRDLEAVPGVEGSTWRAGDIAFKRAPGVEEWRWLGEHLPSIREDGFRLARPIPAADRRWVVEGWGALAWLSGSPPTEARWGEVLSLSDRLDLAMRHLPKPSYVDRRTHPWSIGDRVAWGEAGSPVHHDLLDRLLALRRPVDLAPQLIHGDLTGNVLFADDEPPAVIDPTMYWRPAGYASAIVVGDAVRWEGANPDALLEAVAHLDAFPHLYVRACIFRLVASLLFGGGDLDPYTRDVELAERLLS
jgi:uncharacterized protein (TIGR02569 family)